MFSHRTATFRLHRFLLHVYELEMPDFGVCLLIYSPTPNSPTSVFLAFDVLDVYGCCLSLLLMDSYLCSHFECPRRRFIFVFLFWMCVCVFFFVGKLQLHHITTDYYVETTLNKR